MLIGQFNKNGSIFSRGDHVFNYKQGEQVTIYEELEDNLLKVLIMEGKGKGKLVYINKNKIKFN